MGAARLLQVRNSVYLVGLVEWRVGRGPVEVVFGWLRHDVFGLGQKELLVVIQTLVHCQRTAICLPCTSPRTHKGSVVSRHRSRRSLRVAIRTQVIVYSLRVQLQWLLLHFNSLTSRIVAPWKYSCPCGSYLRAWSLLDLIIILVWVSFRNRSAFFRNNRVICLSSFLKIPLQVSKVRRGHLVTFQFHCRANLERITAVSHLPIQLLSFIMRTFEGISLSTLWIQSLAPSFQCHHRSNNLFFAFPVLFFLLKRSQFLLFHFRGYDRFCAEIFGLVYKMARRRFEFSQLFCLCLFGYF